MAGGYGERRIGPQGNRRAEPARQFRQAIGMRLDRGDHGRRGAEGAGAATRLALGAAEQGAGGGAGRIALEQLGERGALAPSDQLEEAEAVHRGALEWRGFMLA